MNNKGEELNKIIEELSTEESYRQVYHRSHHDIPMPSIEELSEFMELCRQVLFPGYFGNLEFSADTIRYYIGTQIDRIGKILNEQIKRGFCFECAQDYIQPNSQFCKDCETRAKEIVIKFLKQLPKLRRILATDVVAAYEGDPAAKSYGETIFCYPSINVLTNYRVAHELLILGVPLIPRIITEMAHSDTGIDIHPGAQIGEKFFIDHGTGVVIGETCVIGRNVRLYQGVTLGAKSFPLDKFGNPIKGIPRHPIVEDDVIIYAQATVLGRVTIGRGAVIGGNVWVTEDVPPGTRLLQSHPLRTKFEGGEGI